MGQYDPLGVSRRGRVGLFNIMLNLIHSPYTIHTRTMPYLYAIYTLCYALSMLGLWSIYGKNINYLEGRKGAFRKNRKNAQISENTEAEIND